MRAAVALTPRTVELRELPDPVCGDGELLVRVRAVGVCGSDVNDDWVARKVPAVLGHEVAGEVVESRAAGAPGPGEPVVLHHHAPCGACRTCRRGHETLCPAFRATALDPGGFAELVRVPAALAGEVLATGGLDPEVATFTEPLACVLRAFDRAALRDDDRLLVVGCGSGGLLAVGAARARGIAVTVLEPRTDRRARALELGAAEHDGEADVAFVATSHPSAIEAGFAALAPGGTLLLYGVPAAGDVLTVGALAQYLREIRVEASYSAGPADMRAALALLRAADVRPADLVTHRFGLDDVAAALDVQRTAAGVKALVLP